MTNNYAAAPSFCCHIRLKFADASAFFHCLQLDGPTRYNELQRKMETATFRSLSKALKELEADGLIIRKDYGEIPPRVEYSLSERGKSLEPVLDAFCLWGQEHRND